MQHIAVDGLGKRFGVTRALTDVSVAFRPGQITGLVGSNGAGKSTLIKVLAGIVTPDEGTVTIDGQAVTINSPIAARRLGIEVVHQRVDDLVARGMSVAENLVLDTLGDPATPWWFTQRAARRQARDVAAAMRLDVDLAKPIETCSVSERQLVAIARALRHSPRLLILDEPTATLSEVETTRLFELVRGIVGAHSDVAVVFVSHHLQEIETLCDCVVAMRDGRVVLEAELPMPRIDMVEAIIGRAPNHMLVEHRPPGDVVVRLDGVRSFSDSPPIHIDLCKSEIVGLFGLIGAGKSELLRQLFGLTELISGTVTIDDEPLEVDSPRSAIRAGVVYVPEERGALALVDDWSITDNVVLPYLQKYTRGRALLSQQRMTDATTSVIERMGIKCEGAASPVTSLSGGNQQKVVIGRWLQERVRLTLLDEPFRGVDIGARHDIARLLRETSIDSVIVVASADPEEILEVADRVVVLVRGRLVADVNRHDIDSDDLVRLAAS